MLGGLNDQIEHHLFPSMPRPLLKMAQPVVRQYCHEINIPYRESGFIGSMREIHAYLRQDMLAVDTKKGTAGASRKSCERRASKRCRPACLSRGEQ